MFAFLSKNSKFIFIGGISLSIWATALFLGNNEFKSWLESQESNWIFYAIYLVSSFAVGYFTVMSRYIVYFVSSFAGNSKDGLQDNNVINSYKNIRRFGKMIFSLSTWIFITLLVLVIILAITINPYIWFSLFFMIIYLPYLYGPLVYKPLHYFIEKSITFRKGITREEASSDDNPQA